MRRMARLQAAPMVLRPPLPRAAAMAPQRVVATAPHPPAGPMAAALRSSARLATPMARLPGRSTAAAGQVGQGNGGLGPHE